MRRHWESDTAEERVYGGPYGETHLTASCLPSTYNSMGVSSLTGCLLTGFEGSYVFPVFCFGRLTTVRCDKTEA
jgi:hypothetical protein